jgi:enoyl-CoA hydratase
MMNQDFPDFSIEALKDGLLLQLCRPAKLNAITKPILLALKTCMDRLEASAQRILIIQGQGTKAFSAGTDLAETAAASQEERLSKTAMARELFVRLARSELISVAAINGLAFGGGLELAMACSFRVAVPHAQFSLPEIKLGLLPAYGGTQFLPALVGKARASEMMLTGMTLDADKALEIGLIHRLCAPELLFAESLALAREVDRFSPAALAGIRRCLSVAGDEISDAGLQIEDEVVRQVFISADAKEGIAAFLEKRPATFSRQSAGKPS